MAAALPMILSIAGPMIGKMLGGMMGGDDDKGGGGDQQAAALPAERAAPTVASVQAREASRKQAVRGAVSERFREGAEPDALGAAAPAGAAKKKLLGV